MNTGSFGNIPLTITKHHQSAMKTTHTGALVNNSKIPATELTVNDTIRHLLNESGHGRNLFVEFSFHLYYRVYHTPEWASDDSQKDHT